MSDFISVKVDRLWHGLASVRSYTVDKAIQEGRGLRIEFNGRQMTVHKANVHSGRRNKREFTSKINNERYVLVDYPWKEDRDMQDTLL